MYGYGDIVEMYEFNEGKYLDIKTVHGYICCFRNLVFIINSLINVTNTPVRVLFL